MRWSKRLQIFPGNLAFKASVMSPKNVTKVVWCILVQMSSLNNTMSMVSLLRLKGYGGQAGVSVQVAAGKFRNCEFWNLEIEGILSF
jgi:hypothetical protein